MQQSIPSQHINDGWGDPLPLVGRQLPKWPDRVFPEVLESFVRELARSTETPIELGSMLALAVVATASQNKYQVQIKEGYCEPLNLWTMGILPPASRKSSVYKEVTAPLKDWENAQKISTEPLIRSADSHRKTMEARLKGLRAHAAKATNESEYAKLQDEVEAFESKLPEVPTYPQIWASDVTNEQLGVIMSSNDEAMALLSDEGGIFDIISGLYTDGRSNIDLLLQSHAGSPVRVDRGTRPPIFMKRAVLTIGLTVQPQVVRKICSNKTYRGRGLLGRFLYVIPHSNIGSRSWEELPMSLGCAKKFHAVVSGILNHPMPDGDTKIHSLYLEEEAYKKWLEYAKCNETLMGEEIGHLSHITDWAGKLPGAIARIAGLLHVVRYAHQYPCEHKICLHDMVAAVKIGHTLSYHALAVFDLLQEDEAMNIARSIFYWIKEQKFEIFTQRDCSRKFRRHKKTELQASLSLLEEAEIIRQAEASYVGGRPSTVYLVNPKIIRESLRTVPIVPFVPKQPGEES
jgi:hypothetical protein